MEPYQQRVIDEKQELDVKRDKLNAFFQTKAFLALDPAEQKRMNDQHTAMTTYSYILAARIDNFKGA